VPKEAAAAPSPSEAPTPPAYAANECTDSSAARRSGGVRAWKAAASAGPAQPIEPYTAHIAAIAAAAPHGAGSVGVRARMDTAARAYASEPVAAVLRPRARAPTAWPRAVATNAPVRAAPSSGVTAPPQRAASSAGKSVSNAITMAPVAAPTSARPASAGLVRSADQAPRTTRSGRAAARPAGGPAAASRRREVASERHHAQRRRGRERELQAGYAAGVSQPQPRRRQRHEPAGERPGGQRQRLHHAGPPQRAPQVALGIEASPRVDVPGLEGARAERPGRTAEGSGGHEAGEVGGEQEGEAAEDRQDVGDEGRADASEGVGEAAGRELQGGGDGGEGRQDDAHLGEVEAASRQQRHEGGHGQDGRPPAQGQAAVVGAREPSDGRGWGGHAAIVRAMLPEMTPPPSGSSPRRVDDPAAARLLMDATTREVFGCFLGRTRSVREAADVLARDLDAVLYRVRRLVATGLLEVVAVQPRAGRPIRRYRAVHDAWFVPFEALPYADLEETFLDLHVAHAARAARAAARWLADRPWAGYRIGVDEAGRMWMRGAAEDDGASGAEPPRLLGGLDGPMDAGLELRLSPSDARSLHADLSALVATYERRAEEGPANHLLLVISVPIGDG
jgi:hypothetical protein